MAEADHRALLLAGQADAALAALDDAIGRWPPVPEVAAVCIEPRLRNRGGHFARLAARHCEALEQAGLTAAVAHHADWSGPRCDSWHALLPVTDNTVGAGAVEGREVIEGCNRYYEHLFTACLRQYSARLAVFGTARFLTLPGAVRAVEASPACTAAVLGVMETFPVPDCPDDQLVRSALREAARLVAASTRRFLVVAESAPVRDHLLECGFAAERVAVHPYPAALRPFAPPTPPGDADGLRFACLGASRPVQNPGALAAYLAGEQAPPGHWMVKLNLQLASRALGLDRRRLRTRLRDAGVEMLPRELGDEEYDAVLDRAHAMVLPYGERYRTIGSGIFLESVCAGVVPLVPEDSSMARLHAELGGNAPRIEHATAAGISSAVSRFSAGYGNFLAAAGPVRRAWLEHPMGPHAWSRRLRAFAAGR